ncbi:MAG: hypothetical protein R3A52_08160 [Polyangiales bacterium]
MYFGVARTAVTRVFTFDGDGRLPTLDVLLDAGQPLEVFAWCSGTALTALRVAAPDATTVGAGGDGRVAVSASHPAGRYVVSLRGQRPVGLCYARLWAPTVDTERTED